MNKEENILESISRERKEGIANGTIPEWYVTPGYQMFKEKYQYRGQTVKQSFERIAKAAAQHLPKNLQETYYDKFFELLWKGWLAPSTPVMANMGTSRGLPVSCSGSYIGDSVYDFYQVQVETAMLTKTGFGTSAYLGDIRPRGSEISVGGKASGIVPVIKDYVRLASDITQGSTRRGAWAGYIPIDHGDFYEVIDLLLAHPDDLNIGWIIPDSFIQKLDNYDAEAHARYAKVLKAKCITGKGYFLFIDKANKANPETYKKLDLDVKASNLCSEIMLHSDKNHTFTCVLSSLNIAKYNEWKDTDTIFVSTIFLDCVAEEFIQQAKYIKGLENAVRFTKKSRALGLGTLGLHTYFQEQGWVFGDFQSMSFNSYLYQELNQKSLEASKFLAELYGEPEWCEGFGYRNTHRIAIAPNSSSALLVGGVSQSIEPFCENAFNQTGPAGEMFRINPTLLKIMKDRGVYSKKTIKNIIDSMGSVQSVDWLDTKEKEVFKTAFEINQEIILQMASVRQKYIDQGQSLNLFFNADEDENYIAKIHQLAFKDPYIKALYYMRSKAGVQASKEDACLACEG